MKLKNIALNEVYSRCKSEGLILRVGPFNFSIQSELKDVCNNLYLLYADFEVLDTDSIVDFSISVNRATGIRRWYKPQAFFYLDDKTPFLPLPLAQAFPFLEWGMNWCIAKHSNQYLMLHSAVLEKNNKAIILPAESGSGKSTLTAILAANGWRLLSDEMALVCTKTGELTPIARPISLKNESIDLVKMIIDKPVLSDIVADTNKGTISHLRASTDSVKNNQIKAKPAFIIFPKYVSESSQKIESRDKASAFMSVIENSFNYPLLAKTGFDTLTQLMKNVECFDFQYSQTQDALDFFNGLVK